MSDFFLLWLGESFYMQIVHEICFKMLKNSKGATFAPTLWCCKKGNIQFLQGIENTLTGTCDKVAEHLHMLTEMKTGE